MEKGMREQVQQAYRQRMERIPEVDVCSEWKLGTARNRWYPKHCFIKAFEYMMEHEDIAGMKLVHGTYHGGADHAWVELPGGIVFDGVAQRFYDMATYYHVQDAKAEASYTFEETCRAFGDNGQHAGPWHKD